MFDDSTYFRQHHNEDDETVFDETSQSSTRDSSLEMKND
jgi:hypothetical protein